MHEFLKKIFGREKPAPEPLAFEAVPSWLTEREGEARAAVAQGTQEPMLAIRNAVAHLRIILNDLAGAEHDEEVHPKLKTIARNSLPQFTKAMKGSLAREFPEEPEEFYTAAAECVKSCLHNVHGQGRYLQAIFPEEMKGIRQGIDAMGRGINTMNPLLATYRNEMAEVAASRALVDAIRDLTTDYHKAGEKAGRTRARIAETRERCAAIERERQAIPQDPGMQDVDAKKSALDGLCRQRDEAARTYSALSMTASHVFRKAEKIATRQRHPSEVAILNTAMDLLSDHELPGREELDAALAAACPVAERMVSGGEIVLKNREERTVFSDIPQFRAGIGSVIETLRGLEDRCQRAEKDLAGHPLIMAQQSLDREQKQLEAMLAREEEALAELLAWQAKAHDRMPDLWTELGKKIGGMRGVNVQLRAEDRPLS